MPEYPQLHRLLSVVLCHPPSENSKSISAYISHGSVRINLHDRYEHITIDGNAFESLSKLFNVPMGNIEVEAMRETVRGCETCGHGSSSEGGISIKDVPTVDFQELEATAQTLANHYLEQARIEEEEHQNYLKRQRDEANRERAERQKANEREQARKRLLLSIFLLNKEKIFQRIVQRFEDYKNMDRKTMSSNIKEGDPHAPILFKFHVLKKSSRSSEFNRTFDMLEVFEKATSRNTDFQMRLAAEFVDAEESNNGPTRAIGDANESST